MIRLRKQTMADLERAKGGVYGKVGPLASVFLELASDCELLYAGFLSVEVLATAPP